MNAPVEKPLAIRDAIAPMRIVHVEAGRNLYGGALQVKYLLQGLSEFPVHNILICPPSSGIEIACREFATSHSNIEIVPTELKGDFDWRMCARVRRVIERSGADAVHIHSRRGADLWAAWAARQCNKPVLLTRRVDSAETRWLARWKYGRLYDYTLCISDGIRQVLIDEGVDQHRVKTIRSVVDTDHYTLAPDKEWFEKTFAYTTGDLVIGVVAQLIKRKGHSVLFEALKPILQSDQRIQLMVLGKGPLREELESWTRLHGLTQRIRFFGFRDDIQKILPNLYLLAHPAFSEGLGVALLQSAACGVPIVASKVGGIPEVVSHQENGLLVSPGDIQQLTQSLQHLIQYPELRDAYGVCARQRIEQEFSIAKMARQYFQVYKDLIARDHL